MVRIFAYFYIFLFFLNLKVQVNEMKLQVGYCQIVLSPTVTGFV